MLLPYPKMPTKQVIYRNDKAVLVRVYVEKPRKKRPSSIQHHHHHHYHIHHTVRQEVVHGSGSKGSYDRRSGLLKYSRLLRESARGASSTTTPLPSTNKNLQPPTTITPSKKKQPKHAGSSACFGDWKLPIPSFLRQLVNAQKKKKKKLEGFSENLMKKLQVRRGKSLFRNVFSKWV